ncbi:MAG: phosphoglycolate phosphatase [bacterium]|nr:phosphoglycolate phosphatase [bacterium]
MTTLPLYRHVRGVLFDLDGTLIDSRADLTTAVNLLRADYGAAPLPVETVTAFVGDGARNLVRRALADLAHVDIDVALPRFKQHYAAHLTDATRCYPGTHETLAALCAAGLRCALITNKPEAATRALLAHFDLLRFLDPVIGGDTLPVMKPDPQALWHVAASWQLLPRQLLMVGDHYTDISAAHRAGMHAVYLRSGFGTLRDEQPDVILDNITQLLTLLGVTGPAATVR